MKALRWTAITLAVLLVLLGGLLTWAVATTSGAQAVVELAERALRGKLQIAEVRGTIDGPLSLRSLRYSDPEAGVALEVESLAVDLALADLLHATVHVKQARIEGVRLRLAEPARPPPDEQSQPFSLEAPVDVVVDAFTLVDFTQESEQGTALVISKVAFAGQWVDSTIDVEQLAVDSPQGEVRFAGRIGHSTYYEGDGHGTFRWTLGTRVFVGNIETEADRSAARLTLALQRPLAASVRATVRQVAQAPWQIEIDVPRMDPREELLPEGALHELAVRLKGSGNAQTGQFAGEIFVNGEPVHLDALSVNRVDGVLELETRMRPAQSPGVLHIEGSLVPDDDETTAVAHLSWGELHLPEAWVGQLLHTRGDLRLRKRGADFSAKGEVSIGPPERVADVALHIEGDAQAISIQQLDVLQPRGRLAAKGKVGLQPELSWNVEARATQFDPGAFAANWDGSLNFELNSTGIMKEQGPSATLDLDALSGRLRGRAISGGGALQVEPGPTLSGTLQLASGESRIHLRGRQADAMDARLTFNVRSLNDWLPDATGALEGHVEMRGRWPQVAIDARADARAVQYGEQRVGAVGVRVDLQNPLEPSGVATLRMKDVLSGALQFSDVRAEAGGNLATHTLHLEAVGEPLGTIVSLRGGRVAPAAWSGTINELVLDVKDAARLVLREAVSVNVNEGAFDMSRACWVDGGIELCARAAASKDGSLEAQYSMAGVPLALGNVFAPPDLPVTFGGTLDGNGQMRRSSTGTMVGQLDIRSAAGQLTPRGEAAQDAPSVFSYRDFHLAAQLNGESARGTVLAQLVAGGQLFAEASVNGIGSTATPIRASARLTIPSLAPFGVFAPQLANLSGRADATASIAGTLQNPAISGRIEASALAADIPAVGLHLTEGRVLIEPVTAEEFALSGGVRSGDGSVSFSGSAHTDRRVRVALDGDRFLAADIPGARVLITPDLTLTRTAERMALEGELRIPTADVDLQKLPKGNNVQQASSDVVVIDAKTAQEEVEKTPMYADITVVIGDDVELAGFGLAAKVDGQLRVQESPGAPTTGSGEIRVGGRYKAYGQDLTIREGRLLYAASPLDNPGLNLVAVREVGDVTAGLKITGTAAAPELTVFSDPAMGQANALSYLVAGKPLDEIGASEGEGDAVQTAARSLGTAAGGLLAKTIGKRLGVDEVGVKDDEMIGGAALTVGQYLSPRLYLSYGVGLFEPGDVVTLRYKLREGLAVQAQRGPEDTRAGVEYRVER